MIPADVKPYMRINSMCSLLMCGIGFTMNLICCMDPENEIYILSMIAGSLCGVWFIKDFIEYVRFEYAVYRLKVIERLITGRDQE